MTARVLKVLIVMLVLATALLAGNTLVGGRADTEAGQVGTCCQAVQGKACSLQNTESCCQAQTCPAVCPKCCCPDCCCDEPCCLKTKDTTGCLGKQQKPCCASK